MRMAWKGFLGLVACGAVAMAWADPARLPPPPPQPPDAPMRDELRRLHQQGGPMQGMPMQEMGARNEPGRMTPEERRRLRHDINEAGRDIYRRHHQ